jgi:NAD-dependent deacetylase
MIADAAKRIREARAVAVLTGAGVSAESGVPTFRGEGGLWRQFRAEDLATPGAFARDPRLVWEWYDWRRQKIAACRPNPAHHALAALESLAAEFLLITQNIDDLHRKAGSRRLVELHGNIWRVRCTREGTVSALPDVPLDEIPPRCGCGALLRPDVVWFGESLPVDALERAMLAAETCELFLVVGTSTLVQPAASLPLVAKGRGAAVIEVNPDPTPISHLVDVSLRGKAGEILPALLAGLDIAS